MNIMVVTQCFYPDVYAVKGTFTNIVSKFKVKENCI